MTTVPSRDLRNHSRSLLARVEEGESLTITVDGRPVARLEPVERRRRWLSRDEFARRILDHQADAALAGDLAALADETTDDLPFS